MVGGGRARCSCTVRSVETAGEPSADRRGHRGDVRRAAGNVIFRVFRRARREPRSRRVAAHRAAAPRLTPRRVAGVRGRLPCAVCRPDAAPNPRIAACVSQNACGRFAACGREYRQRGAARQCGRRRAECALSCDLIKVCCVEPVVSLEQRVTAHTQRLCAPPHSSHRPARAARAARPAGRAASPVCAHVRRWRPVGTQRSTALAERQLLRMIYSWFPFYTTKRAGRWLMAASTLRAGLCGLRARAQPRLGQLAARRRHGRGVPRGLARLRTTAGRRSRTSCRASRALAHVSPKTRAATRFRARSRSHSLPRRVLRRAQAREPSAVNGRQTAKQTRAGNQADRRGDAPVRVPRGWRLACSARRTRSAEIACSYCHAAQLLSCSAACPQCSGSSLSSP